MPPQPTGRSPARGSPEAEPAIAFAREAACRFGVASVVWRRRRRRLYRILRRFRPDRRAA